MQKIAGQTMVQTVQEALRRQIQDGQYEPGARLPSEAQLTQDFDVSRTVIREAIAALRADGLVEARQGAGVFVQVPAETTGLPFQNLDFQLISSMVELLELRTAVETEAAALAAQRRSPAQEEVLIAALGAVQQAAESGAPTMEADFALHLAIANATNNPRFAEFLTMIGPNVIPRRALADSSAESVSQDYILGIQAEHEAIVSAILDRDEDAAREAMRTHLKGSQKRYRSLLRDAARKGMPLS
ncbi:FadR/GntR family transcriptional regulator [Roseinatronobacter alkalisoli]|uniref:FadR/GntR family transcriptional regulator n=1 Tax=Roseinatronobacter alkalisoli TaxID=3028235 RepID=A0ABT5T783_9RHOB|nr:FadR/GntR family transcriptional regulator [Roseinatronobacter sp. HJB301]MDD7970992.1 FadR/GntR family transcriptional regulator [Roseinatronobacter sp. HJB301]